MHELYHGRDPDSCGLGFGPHSRRPLLARFSFWLPWSSWINSNLSN